MYNKFLEELMKYINSFAACYYELAPNQASFPYSVLSNINTTDLRSGDLTMLDFMLYTNELGGTEEIEALADLFRSKLEGYQLNSEGNFNSYISFENRINATDPEQDLIVRRMSFSARIFFK